MLVEKAIADVDRRITRVEQDVTNLRGWQKTQNGSLLRIDTKVDKLTWWIMGVLATTIASIFITIVTR